MCLAPYRSLDRSMCNLIYYSNFILHREDVGEYCKNTRRLALRLLEAISESLGLERDYIVSCALGKHAQHVAINYYPPCPQPELTYGLPVHADPNVITILIQDDVPGLQVHKDGKWIAVNPMPYTFIVNIGDQIQVITELTRTYTYRKCYKNSSLGFT